MKTHGLCFTECGVEPGFRDWIAPRPRRRRGGGAVLRQRVFRFAGDRGGLVPPSVAPGSLQLFLNYNQSEDLILKSQMLRFSLFVWLTSVVKAFPPFFHFPVFVEHLCATLPSLLYSVPVSGRGNPGSAVWQLTWGDRARWWRRGQSVCRFQRPGSSRSSRSTTSKACVSSSRFESQHSSQMKSMPISHPDCRRLV